MKIHVEKGELDLNTGQLASTEICLTRIERGLVRHLVEAGEPVGPQRLLEQVWGYRQGVKSRTIYSTVNRVRQKLERHPNTPIHLLKVEGGYTFRALANVLVDVPIGRHEDIEAVLRRLTFGPVVVYGPGGVGKTTLARAVVANTHDRQTIWVDLRDVTEETVLWERLAAVMDVLDPMRVVEVLSCGEPRLVVLDDLDVYPAVAEVLEALGSVPGLQVLMTRRDRPDQGFCHPLRPLNIDDARTVLAGAGCLLPAATLDRIAEQLGRLPLALTLAGRWLPALGTDVGDHALRLPGLRGSIARSWDRLSVPAQDLLTALAHLAPDAPASLAAALAGRDLAPLDEVERLSLAVIDEGVVRLLQPVRAFAMEHNLDPLASGVALHWLEVRTAHLQAMLYTTQQAQAVAAYLRERLVWRGLLERMDTSETGILSRVVEFACLCGAPAGLDAVVERTAIQMKEPERSRLRMEQARLHQRLGGAPLECLDKVMVELLPIWDRHVYHLHRGVFLMHEGALVDAGQALARASQGLVRACSTYRRVLFAQAKLARMCRDVAQAQTLLDELELLSIDADDPVHQMVTEALRGSIAKREHRHVDAEVHLRRAKALAVASGSWSNHAHLGVSLAHVLAYTNQVPLARRGLRESAAYYQRSGAFHSLGFVEHTRTCLYLWERDEQAALKSGHAALRIFQRSADATGVEASLGLLARLHLGFGRPLAAIEVLRPLVDNGGFGAHAIRGLLALAQHALGQPVEVPDGLPQSVFTDHLCVVLGVPYQDGDVSAWLLSKRWDVMVASLERGNER